MMPLSDWVSAGRRVILAVSVRTVEESEQAISFCGKHVSGGK